MASNVRRFRIGRGAHVGSAACQPVMAHVRDGPATHHRRCTSRAGLGGDDCAPGIHDRNLHERLPDPAGAGLRHFLAPTAHGSDEALDILTRMLHYALGETAPAIAQRLLMEATTLPRALTTPSHHVRAMTGDDRVACFLGLLVRAFNHMIEVGLKAPDVHPGAEQVRLFMLHRLNHEKVEVLYGLFFHANGSLLHDCELARGNSFTCMPSACEIARTALSLGAAAVVLAHNHPSGSAQPSRQDVRFSADVAASLSLADAVLIDHYVVSNGATTSMRKLGLLPEELPRQGGAL